MITSKILKLYENVWLVEYITPGRLLRTCCPSPPGAGMNTPLLLFTDRKTFQTFTDRKTHRAIQMF